MPDSLSVAIGTVLATLELVENKHGVVSDVRLVHIEDRPTNIIEFKMGGNVYEVTINKSVAHEPKMRPSLQRVKLNIRDHAKDKGTNQLTSVG